MCATEEISCFQKEEESPFWAWSFHARRGFTPFFLCLRKTRLPTCLSLVAGLPKLPPVRLKISTHAPRMPHQCFVRERLVDISENACYFNAAAAVTRLLCFHLMKHTRKTSRVMRVVDTVASLRTKKAGSGLE